MTEMDDCGDMDDEIRFLRSFNSAILRDHDRMVLALLQYRDDLMHPPDMGSRDRRIKMINELLEGK